MSSLSFDPVAARYDATRGGEARGRFVADVLRPWLPSDGRVLEIGVGTAVVATALAATGRPVFGADLSLAMLEIAAGRPAGPFVQADASALPVAGGTLSAVYAVWVLHLVGDLPTVIAECHRTLRSGGRLLAVVADESRRIGDPAVVELERRYRQRADDLDNLEPLAAEAGFHRAHVEPVAAFNRPMSPRELADHLEQRTWSWTWKVPAEAWPTEVEPVIAELRSRPDADQARPQRVANLLVVWER